MVQLVEDHHETFTREHGCTKNCVDEWIELNSPWDNIHKDGVNNFSISVSVSW